MEMKKVISVLLIVALLFVSFISPVAIANDELNKVQELNTIVKEGEDLKRDEDLKETAIQETKTYATPDSEPVYTMATDEDFVFVPDSIAPKDYMKDGVVGFFAYIGDDKYVEIPKVIQGIEVKYYYRMFATTSFMNEPIHVEGVKSANPVVSFAHMFAAKDDLNDGEKLGLIDRNTGQNMDVTGLNSSRVTTFYAMFHHSDIPGTLDVTGIVTSRATTLQTAFAFSEAKIITGLETWDVSNVTSMNYIFGRSHVEKVNLTGWNTSKLTDLTNAFVENKLIEILGLKEFDVSNVTQMNSTFGFLKVPILDLEGWNVEKVTNMSLAFYKIESNQILGLETWKAQSLTAATQLFTESKATNSIDLSGFNMSKVPSLNNFFKDSNFASIKGIENWDVSNVTVMTGLFQGVFDGSIDISSWNTSKVTTANNMFAGSTVEVLDLSTLDLSKLSSVSGFVANTQSTKSWVKTQAIADKLNASPSKPANFFFYVKQAPIIKFSPNGSVAPIKTTNVSVNAELNGANLINFKYAWSSSTTPPADNSSTWTNLTNGASVSTPETTGNMYLHIIAQNDIDFETRTYSSPFNLDNKAPLMTLEATPTIYTNKNVDILVWTSDESGIKKIIFPDSTVTPPGENTGVYNVDKNGTYSFTVEDNAGNITTKTIEISNIDKTPPEFTISKSTEELTYDFVELTISNLIDESGVKSIRSIEQNLDITDTKKIRVTENGTYTFSVEDNAGNVSTKSIIVSNIGERILKLTAPTIGNFGAVPLTPNVQVISKGISPILVSDRRSGLGEWSLNVQATPLKQGNVSMPSGHIRIKGTQEVSNIAGGNKGEFAINSNLASIDEGSMNLVKASSTNGEYEIELIDEALEFVIDPTLMKVGTYETTITWELQNTPTP